DRTGDLRIFSSQPGRIGRRCTSSQYAILIRTYDTCPASAKHLYIPCFMGFSDKYSPVLGLFGQGRLDERRINRSFAQVERGRLSYCCCVDSSTLQRTLLVCILVTWRPSHDEFQAGKTRSKKTGSPSGRLQYGAV